MEFQYPQYREKVRHLRHIPDADGRWSGWQKLIVPGRDLGRDYKNRNGNNEGSYRVGRYLPKEGVCGIYEWRVKNEDDKIIVYVGSSCNDGNAPLRDRILDYCTDGAHKSDLINDALGKGYEMNVRYMEFEGVDESKDAEDFLLKRYNYAWNVRGNGIRKPVVGKLTC